MDLHQLIINSIETGVGALLIMLVHSIVRLAKGKLSIQQQQLIEMLATQAVRYVEEHSVTLSLTSEEKLTKASEWLVEQASKYKIKLNEDDVKEVILSALRKLRDEFADTWKEGQA